MALLRGNRREERPLLPYGALLHAWHEGDVADSFSGRSRLKVWHGILRLLPLKKTVTRNRRLWLPTMESENYNDRSENSIRHSKAAKN